VRRCQQNRALLRLLRKQWFEQRECCLRLLASDVRPARSQRATVVSDE
jgi:hypothetical protein